MLQTGKSSTPPAGSPIVRVVHRAVVVFALTAHPSRAEQLIGKPDGLMCRDPKALADLTLPDGRSRADQPHATPAQQAEAAACIPSMGAIVDVVTRRHNTTIVTIQEGSRGLTTWYAPNIDFVRRPPGCIADEARVTLTGRIELHHQDANPDTNQPAYDYPRLHLDRPVCFLGRILVLAEGTDVSLPTTTKAGNPALMAQIGHHVTIDGNLGNPDSPHQPPDPMMMFDPVVRSAP